MAGCQISASRLQEDEADLAHFPGRLVGRQLPSDGLLLSPSEADSQTVLWGKDEDHTGQSQWWVTGLASFYSQRPLATWD